MPPSEHHEAIQVKCKPFFLSFSFISSCHIIVCATMHRIDVHLNAVVYITDVLNEIKEHSGNCRHYAPPLRLSVCRWVVLDLSYGKQLHR